MKFFFSFSLILLFSIVVLQSQDEFSDDDFLLNEFSDEYSDTIVPDHFYDYNKAMTSINDSLFINVLNPISYGYSYVVPHFMRKGIFNIFDNFFAFPVRFINNVLQLKAKNSIDELSRFVLNSTIGIVGLFDVASLFDIRSHDEDFGQTMGYYGVEGGPHIVIPIIGPSNIRDASGKVFAFFINNKITSYSNIGFKTSALLKTFDFINEASLRQGEYENAKSGTFDLYVFLKDAYEKSRQKSIKE